MISLVGEQPVPSLLPIRHIKPDEVILIQTNTSKRVSENLKPVLEKQCQVKTFEVTPYDIIKAKRSLEKCVSEQKIKPENLLFNLTGGTKPMSLAAFQLAQELKSSFTYLQSEGGKSLLYLYAWNDEIPQLLRREEIGSILTIEDFLKVYGRGDFFKKSNNNQHQHGAIFENAVSDTLSKICDEVKQSVSFKTFPHVELDLVFRIGNQIGIGEAKTGIEAGKKSSIDQLNSPTHREFLGIYTKKFLFLQGTVSRDNQKLIDAYRIKALEINKPLTNGKLSLADFELLKEEVTKSLKS